MTLRIHNSLTQKTEEFRPIREGEVSMYVCGPTVYDEPHIGHLRSAFVFDVMRRHLSRSYNVKFVRNVTDVDDKIIDKAAASKPADLVAETKAVSSKYYDLYRKDLERLGIAAPDVEPRATGHIAEMIELIEGLVAKGAAYPAGGDVYYEVRKFSGYGKLSHQNVEQILENVRLEKNEKKRDTLDFALWKAAKPGEPSWPSPWGPGRPGWHIECSAMSKKHLAQTFDVHGGGRDLIFPHHENEIAQSEGLSGKPLANYWVHHGLITVEQVKMSKSLKNYVTLDSIAQKRGPSGVEELKLLFLGTHYSAPLDYSEEKMEMERSILKKFKLFMDDAMALGEEPLSDTGSEDIERAFLEAMNDDFNTPQALTILHEAVHTARKSNDKSRIRATAKWINSLAKYLGLNFLRKYEDQFIESEVNRRIQAKKNLDFKLADEIRASLLMRGVVLRDLPDGNTKWTLV